MKIERVRSFNVKGGGIHPVIVELTTADGMTGYGEAAVAYGLGANAAAGMLADMAIKVIGSDATHPRNLWHEVYDKSFWTKGGGAIVFAALSAIDQALWDIKAKALGIPVYELFGAKFSDSIEVYANGWNFEHDDVEEWAKAAERPLSDGYKNLKSYPLATSQPGGTLVHVTRRSLSSDELNRAIETPVQWMLSCRMLETVGAFMKLSKLRRWQRPTMYGYRRITARVRYVLQHRFRSARRQQM